MTFWGAEKLPSPDDPEAPAIAAADDAHAHDGGHGGDDHGTARADSHGHGSHVGHESPPIMTYPLFALAGCTILIGLVCLVAGPFWGTTEWFAHHLHATLGFESLGHEEHHFDWWTALIGTVAGVGGLALSYRMYAEPSPLPGRLAERLRPLYRGVARQVPGRRALRLAGRPADPRAGGRLRVSRHVSGGSAGDRRGQASPALRPGRAGPVPERTDPVLRGRFGALGGDPALHLGASDAVITRWGQLTLGFRPRGLTDGDTAGDHGPAPALSGAWFWCSMPRLEAHTARLIGLGFTLVTLALSLILLLAFQSDVTTPAVRVRGLGRALWPGLDRAPGHPVRPGPRRPLALALFLDVVA